MSQPPGPYGRPEPYGRPGGYGPPGSYGQPGPYGRPGPGGPFGPGGPGPGGYGQPPQKRSALPWLVAALVVVLAGIGVLLFVRLGGDDAADTAGNSTSASTSSPAVETGMDMEGAAPPSIPGGASAPPARNPGGGTGGDMEPQSEAGADEGQYPGSGDVAVAFMNGILEFDVGTVFTLSCATLRDEAISASAGTEQTPEEYLTAFFYDRVLAGETISGGQSTSVVHDPGSGLDVVSFDVTTTGGTPLEVLVGVDQALTVCGFA